MFFAANRTQACRSELLRLGWLILPWRVRADSPGASRRSYLCPEHHDVRPAGWRDERARVIVRLAKERRTRPLNLDNVDAPTRHIDSARRSAMLWMLVEANGTQLAVARAAGMTRQWVNHDVIRYETILERRHASAEGWQEPWAKRLRVAGAIK